MARRENVLLKRFNQGNYSGIHEFIQHTHCPISFETIRLAIYDNKPVSTPSLILIMKYLGFSADEIRNHLLGMGEQEFSSLLSGDRPALAECESILLEFMRQLKQTEPMFFNALLSNVNMAARAVGAKVDVNRYLIRGRPKRG